jgi:membrane peptidoglycan carboxypeptidase
VSSNDFDGPHRPAEGRGADDYSGDAQGGDAQGRGATGAHGAGRGGKGNRGGYARGNGRNGNGRAPAGGKYPAPEGWANDGFWRDQSIDADYETGLNAAVPDGPDPRVPGNGGYSYWADGKGWENSPGTGGASGSGASGNGASGNGSASGRGAARGGPRGDATGHGTRADSYATRADYGAGSGGAGGGDATAFYGAGGDPTAAYGNGQDPGEYRAGGPGPGGGPGRGGPGGPSRPGRPGRPGGPGRNGRKGKGSWWRRWTWKKAFALVGAAFAVVILASVGAYFYAYSSTQVPIALAANVLDQTTTVYYSDGKTVIGTFGTVNRQILNYNQIPKKTVQDAVVAAEDRGFWTEGGVSPTGILRAAYDNLTSSGGSLSGGSTITQQFVRNYYDNIGTSQTATRKIKEIFIAMKVSKAKSKQWILTNYLNTIYLGDNSYGVAAAAQTYFGVPVSKLTIAQAAVIAAIIQQPSNYPQPQFRSALTARWHYVLNGMVKTGDLSQAQADSMSFPKLLTDQQSTGTQQAYGTTSSNDPWAPYIMNVVYNELTAPSLEHVSTSELENGGLKIITTISRPMEVELYSAVNQNVKLIRQEGYTLPSYAMIGAELQDPGTGAIVAMYPGRGQNMTAKQCAIYKCNLNTAVYTREQVGSSFKPYVLATAVSQGMNVQTSILNTSPYLCVPPDSGPAEYSVPVTLSEYDLPGTSTGCNNPNDYKVENDAGEIIGNNVGTATSGANAGAAYYSDGVQNALAMSSNTAYTDLAHRAGTQNIVNTAANFGVNTASFPAGSGLQDKIGQVGMALGTGSLTVNEQASMLSTIDDNGTYHSAHIIESWQQPDGPVNPGVVTQRQVLTPAQDSQVQYAMEKTTVDGTGTAAAMTDGRPIIGKTGTTTNSKAAFFIGAIRQYSLAVGIFTQSQDSKSPQTLTALGGGGFGGTWPANIWHTFAEAEFAQLPVEQFQTPVFTGAKWNQVGNLPKKKPTKKTKPKTKKGGAPTPSQTPTSPGHGHGHGHNPSPSLTPTPIISLPVGLPISTASATPTASPTVTDTATSSPTTAGPSSGGAGGGG